MTKTHRLAGLAVFAMICFPSVSEAADGWKMPNLNPFKKASTSSRARASVSDRSSWTMPTLKMPTWKLPTWPHASRSRSGATAGTSKQAPSTLDKLNQGTKEFFGKTKDVLMPWAKSPPTRSTSARSRTKPSSWFSSWFVKKKEPKKIRSVTDFLSLERPD